AAIAASFGHRKGRSARRPAPALSADPFDRAPRPACPWDRTRADPAPVSQRPLPELAAAGKAGISIACSGELEQYSQPAAQGSIPRLQNSTSYWLLLGGR